MAGRVLAFIYLLGLLSGQHASNVARHLERENTGGHGSFHNHVEGTWFLTTPEEVVNEEVKAGSFCYCSWNQINSF
jgi:hypothetical protein